MNSVQTPYPIEDEVKNFGQTNSSYLPYSLNNPDEPCQSGWRHPEPYKPYDIELL